MHSEGNATANNHQLDIRLIHEKTENPIPLRERCARAFTS